MRETPGSREELDLGPVPSPPGALQVSLEAAAESVGPQRENARRRHAQPALPLGREQQRFPEDRPVLPVRGARAQTAASGEDR